MLHRVIGADTGIVSDSTAAGHSFRRVYVPGDREPVDVGQLNVEHHDVRPESLHLRKRLLADRGLSHDVEALHLEQRTRRGAEARMVVDDQHRRAHVHMLAVQLPTRTVASPNPAEAKSRAGTEADLLLTSFRAARPPSSVEHVIYPATERSS